MCPLRGHNENHRAVGAGPADCRKTFFDFMHHLQPIDWFVGNGLDRSVLPCQKHDATRKPRAIRRDFNALRAARCADGSRPIPTNLPVTDFFYKLGRGAFAPAFFVPLAIFRQNRVCLLQFAPCVYYNQYITQKMCCDRAIYEGRWC